MKSEGPADPNGCLNLKPRLFYAALALTLYFIVFGFTYSMFSLVILERTGNDYGLASTYTGAYSAITNLATFLFSPLIGVLSDRYGRKPFIILSMAAVAFDCFSVITVPYLWVLIITKFIYGSFTSMFTSTYAYAADVSTPERLAKDFGTLGIAFGVAFSFSPVLAGWLGNKYSLLLPYYIGFCVAIVGLLYSSIILPDSKKKEKIPFDRSRLNPLRSFYLLKKNKITLFMSIIFFMLNFAEQAMIDTIILYVKWRFDWNAFQVGIMSSVFGICYMFAQGVVVRIAIPLLKERKTILFGIFINAITVFPYGLATNSWQIYLLYVVRSFGLIALPTTRAYICAHFEAKQQGEVAGVLAGLQTLASFIGPFLFNTMFSYFVSPDAIIQMPQIIFYMTSVFFLLILGASILLFRMVPHEEEVKLKSPKIVRINGDDEEERLLGSV